MYKILFEIPHHVLSGKLISVLIYFNFTVLDISTAILVDTSFILKRVTAADSLNLNDVYCPYYFNWCIS